MRLSNKKITRSVEERITESLFQIISDIRNNKDAKTLLTGILTETEQLAVAKRLAIALLLQQQKSYEEIKKELKVSSATVAKVQETLDSPGIKLALDHIKTDEWATNWARKISQTITKLLGS